MLRRKRNSYDTMQKRASQRKDAKQIGQRDEVSSRAPVEDLEDTALYGNRYITSGAYCTFLSILHGDNPLPMVQPSLPATKRPYFYLVHIKDSSGAAPLSA
jgi:hypothetical protein